MMKTRFAPSPTGYIHIGNVRSAIYPFLIARKMKGNLILRIEDTDQARYVEGATDLIMDTLKWLGMDWDEGPIVGGPNGPYYQTERREIYHEWAQKLIDAGRAYADPTPPEQVAKYREECVKKKVPFLYRNFRPENPPEWKPGLPLRFKSDPQPRKWYDEVFGDLHAGPEMQDDFIMIKSDGLPTYNFAHIVDDYLMGVTHVIRGAEYLASMSNYLAMYEAFGIEVPKFALLPAILPKHGNKKLSKRDGAKSVTDYRADGILPQAMFNYLACLGWNDGTEQEIYTMEELINAFSLDRIQVSGARFDEDKLFWVNGQWIRKIADEQGIEELYKYTDGFWPKEAEKASDERRIEVLGIIYDRLKTLADLRTMTPYFFAEPEVDIKQITENKFIKKIDAKELPKLLEQVIAALESSDWAADALQKTLNDLLEETGTKPAQLFSLIRIAVSFAPFSPALHLTLATLGKETALKRLRAVLDIL